MGKVCSNVEIFYLFPTLRSTSLSFNGCDIVVFFIMNSQQQTLSSYVSHELIVTQRRLSLKKVEIRKQASVSSLTGMLMAPLLKVKISIRCFVVWSGVVKNDVALFITPQPA